MIYKFPGPKKPIEQGDIFYPLPLISISLEKIPVIEKEEIVEYDWLTLRNKPDSLVGLQIIPTWGIVASQNCDATNSSLISFFEINSFVDVTGLHPPLKKSEVNKWWKNTITKKSREEAKWFYLPQNKKIGFKDRMAVDFKVMFQVLREDLEKHVKELRRGRLNEIAYEHYREKIAQYFRRYPYDEWYPLNKEELDEYIKEKGQVSRFKWQK